jgi:hypothetical protein
MSKSGPVNDSLHRDARRAFVRFRDALTEFAEDPSPDNLVRYLAASRVLDESRSSGAADGVARDAPPSTFAA